MHYSRWIALLAWAALRQGNYADGWRSIAWVAAGDNDTLYFLRHNQNILSRFEPATGKPRGEPLRLDGIEDFIFASPVGAAGRIYVTGRDGTTVVLRHDRENGMIARNHLDDSFSASPALAGRELYLRGERLLYSIEERENL